MELLKELYEDIINEKNKDLRKVFCVALVFIFSVLVYSFVLVFWKKTPVPSDVRPMRYPSLRQRRTIKRNPVIKKESPPKIRLQKRPVYRISNLMD